VPWQPDNFLHFDPWNLVGMPKETGGPTSTALRGAVTIAMMVDTISKDSRFSPAGIS